MQAQPLQTDNYQRQFQRRWQHLHDPHVRALAWLLESPDLLSPVALQWPGKIATIGSPLPAATLGWLAALDAEPHALHAYLAIRPFTRLGRYAERLMAFYFEAEGILKAHGVQVRANKNDTIGEFDFLLRQGENLLHWEFATKLYLLEPTGKGQAADYFVGPNLADTLGAKMHKIFDQQLKLAQHPAAQCYLPQPVSLSQALIKGWLFYHNHQASPVQALGVSPDHCRGFWCELSEVGQLEMQHAIVLPRLSWLAPARVATDALMDRQELLSALTAHFAQDSMPLLIAIMERQSDTAIEVDRGFIVPNDWRTRAGQRIQRLGIT